jgi:tellurite resistance protein TehA-like permease
MTKRTRISLFVLFVSLVVAATSAVVKVGSEERLVDVITLFTSGVAFGAAIAALFKRH